MHNYIIFILIALLTTTVIVSYFLYVRLQRKIKNASLNYYGKFEKLIEYGSDCVIIISPEAKTTYVSPSITNILGYSVSEVLNIDIRDMIHPEDVLESEKKLAEVIQNPGKPIPGYTARIKHKDGTWRYLEPVVTNFLHDPEINGIVDNFRDVTDRIIAENKLKEINDRLLLAIKGSSIGIWDYDFHSSKLVWDETMHKIYGTDSNFQNNSLESWLELIFPEDRDFVNEKITKSISLGNSFDITFRINDKDSGVRHVRSLVQVYKDELGAPIRLIGTNLDVTNNKEYELTLEQILFDISHIIRNPVAKILGLSNLIETETINDNLVKEYTEFIKESAEELDKYTKLLNETYQKKKLTFSVY